MKTRHKLSIEGHQFLLNDMPFDMWGIRVASGTMDQNLTDHLIAQLDDYKAHGINSVAVYYQGCRGGSYDPFSADGTKIDDGHQNRMEQIIKACDQRGMVVIAGIFYQSLEYNLDSPQATHNATQLVSEKLKGYGNVIINTANEQNSSEYARNARFFDFNDPQKIISLCRTVKKTDPDRIVGGGGYKQENNAVISLSPDVDVLLFDTAYSAEVKWDDIMETCYPWLRENGSKTKPMVNVESFGGWTKKFPRGIFEDEIKQIYYVEVDEVVRQDGLYFFFHNNPWCQCQDDRMRYDLAGYGSPDDPGIRWYFEYVARKRGIKP